MCLDNMSSVHYFASPANFSACKRGIRTRCSYVYVNVRGLALGKQKKRGTFEGLSSSDDAADYDDVDEADEEEDFSVVKVSFCVIPPFE